ncbi:formate--tetrahydrofolate ligase [Belliella aquatica]|uniref:Formate--tetrahydrofolate ligase n=1 Tax=Belliella aquatica TaxID=1323734 RepID=A0ABQ1MEB9_9BACT|nr:formate--tetrahydrofolate ligase [Belliella aquatica]MCH7405178.1 formate--tetrahydrofolate ligase [Belliella aquatica]GGC39133.1 formate--tetrahydrofolate ligase [Belliella aquatica]
MTLTDQEIARASTMQPISEIAKKLQINEDDLRPYGKYIAKLPLRLIDSEKMKGKKLILVTAITPTVAGEGKTTASIGLCEGLNKIGVKTAVVLREPSLGPVFGMKGGAAGGGYSQVLPMESINLHFTGDFAAVEKSHNLLAALLDNHIHQGNSLNIDPRKIVWKRVMDMNERALRDIVIGLGGHAQGVPRESGFDITAASEVMAALCLANDLVDLKDKLGNIIVAYTHDNQPVYARELKAQGAMTALLKHTIMPNLVQTIEGNAAIIHGGPFANIAQGSNSIIATKMGLSLADYVVTEAGFASDLGGEKFLDLKCQYGGLKPDLAVIVATIRALKSHAGIPFEKLKEANTDAVRKGLENLEKHIENIKHFMLCPVVAINKFATDSEEEINVVMQRCEELGVKVALSEGWEKGGEGCIDLAKTVQEVAESGKSNFTPLYNFEWPIEQKIETVARKIYGAADVEYSLKAKQQIKLFNKIGLDKVPICIAKTQYSLSDDPKLINRPIGFTIKIRAFDIAAGAGFIIPIAGNIMRMPGLPSKPAAENIDIDAEGNITGLF